jgi:hypothetical protein
MVGAAAAATAALTVTAVVVAVATGGGAQASGGSGAPASTATVVRTDLASTTQVGGSIGYDGSYTIVNPAGVSAQALTQAEQAVASAQAALSADAVSARDSEAAGAQSIDQAQTAVDTAQAALSSDQSKQSADCAGAGASSPGCATDTQKVSQDQAQLAQQQGSLASARLSATRTTHQDQAKRAADAMALANAEQALATAQRTAANPGATYTSVPVLGQIVSIDQQLYAVDGKPVPLLYGSTAMWRDFRLGMSDGPDVGELTADLIALGFGGGLAQGNHFSDATAAAVTRWQAALGLDQTGVIRLGEVCFEPGPVRVSALHVSTGAAASPGPVLDATSTTRVVTVALPVTDEYLVHAGDAVSVVLPDGKTTTSGHVRTISGVATAPSGGQGGSSTPTVSVTVVLDRPGETGNLDQAPVEVNITDQAVHGVLAVPINALLALSEGGDAVEVVAPDGSRRLVAVQTGLFSDTMVQVSGPDIVAGMRVEVPSS